MSETQSTRPGRAEGYYWVKDEVLGWTPALWTGQRWLLVGMTSECDDDDLLEIDRDILMEPRR